MGVRRIDFTLMTTGAIGHSISDGSQKEDITCGPIPNELQ